MLWGRLAGAGSLSALACAWLTLRKIDQVKRHGGILVWTVHNLHPNRPMTARIAKVWDQFFKAFRARVDLTISLTASAQAAMGAAYPEMLDRPHVIIPHPHYRTAYPPASTKESARKALGLPAEAKVLCSIGEMRRNKGLGEIISAFRLGATEHDILLLCGGCEASFLRELESLRGDDSRIRLMPRHLSNEDVAQVLSAANGFVLNHHVILNSGSLLLALSFDLPVLVRLQGSVGDLAAEIGPAWIQTFEGDLDEHAIRSFMHGGRLSDGENDRAPLDRFDPDLISSSTLEQYRNVLAQRGSRAASSA
ncbi:glycosyltransferase family protein [Geminicoccus roseus]|uniref:hypothetical protein n=1 Tax=Geminicoccus roseus TaxID=404900 RepID=UPI0004822871|nr:hypothetical protein [Geminicoccus roseus]